jgi:hypothetical protein
VFLAEDIRHARRSPVNRQELMKRDESQSGGGSTTRKNHDKSQNSFGNSLSYLVVDYNVCHFLKK